MAAARMRARYALPLARSYIGCSRGGSARTHDDAANITKPLEEGVDVCLQSFWREVGNCDGYE